jgi:DNA-binding GntR family transcriptional regulator
MSDDMYVPKFQAAVDYIVEKIDTGEWPPGHRLPSQTDWADGVENIRVHYGTLRQAYLILKTMDIIEGRQGDGVFVKELKVKGTGKRGNKG